MKRPHQFVYLKFFVAYIRKLFPFYLNDRPNTMSITDSTLFDNYSHYIGITDPILFGYPSPLYLIIIPIISG